MSDKKVPAASPARKTTPSPPGSPGRAASAAAKTAAAPAVATTHAPPPKAVTAKATTSPRPASASKTATAAHAAAPAAATAPATAAKTPVAKTATKTVTKPKSSKDPSASPRDKESVKEAKEGTAAPARPRSSSSSSAKSATVTPAEVLKFTGPTSGYLCPLAANTYGIDFIEFKIREMDANRVLFHVRKDADAPTPDPSELDDTARFIQYDFGEQFLDIKTVGTTLVFKVGPKEIKSFRMIERHYFGNKLLKSFDFTFGFCIPNSQNEWEVIYTLPKLNDAEKADMIASPYQTKSDSFYFVDDQLIMHNKAEYAYTK